MIIFLSYIIFISPKNSLNYWEKINKKGYLSWITRTSPFTYYNSIDGIIGLEYNIVSNFADFNGLKLNITIAPSNNELFEKFNVGNISLAGANLTLTDERKNKYLSSIAYDETYISLISSTKKPKLSRLESISQYQGMVLKNSSYEEIAQQLIKKYNAKIEIIENKSIYEILSMLSDSGIDFTFADANLIAIFKAFIPNLRQGIQLSKNLDLVFLINSNDDGSLKKEIDNFIKVYKKDNKVSSYKNIIADILPNSKEADNVQFLKSYVSRWHKIRSLVYQVAKEYDWDPILLGAISYQESHWNVQAVSVTLVKGLMMLTKDVANEQGVSDRLDPQQSLRGGVEYLIKMKNRVPDRITDPDRTNFALVAYNIGYGNLEKARVITQKNGKNPDIYEDVKDFLPLLNNMAGIKVDGKTAVTYVKNIRIYQKLLQWKEQL